VINTNMTTDMKKLEKIIEEQNKQINSLKKAIAGLQQRIIAVAKKTDRAYHSGRKNANDINNITGILKRNQ